MRRVVIMLLALVACIVSAVAQTTPQEWLTKLRSTLGSSYAWNISVATSGEQFEGYYIVEGDSYYLRLGAMEVYSDGKLRYEVNNARKEVTEDRVNLKAVDLLANPTRAFSFVDKEYSITLNSTSSSGAVLSLVPKSDSVGVTHITLELEQRGGVVVPLKIKYSYDDDSITISLSKRSVAVGGLPRWNKVSYADYDIVSFL
jgi:hypothetical protein